MTPVARQRGQRRHDPVRIAAVVRQSRAVAYRLLGFSYREIAAQVGFRNKQAAWKSVHAAIARAGHVPHAELERARLIEVERVDALFPAIYRKALAGDADAISTVLDLMAFRARLLGLDASKKVEVGGAAPQLASAVPSMTVVHIATK